MNALGDVRALLFDLDGTLADTVPTILLGLGDAFEKFLGSRPSDDVLRSMIGRPLADQMNLLGLAESTTESLETRMAYAMGQFRTHQARSRLFESPVSGLRFATEQGFPTAIVTSKNRQEFQEFLETYPDFPTVHAICAEDADRPKPSADPAIAACRHLGVMPEDSAMIGDSAFDLQCGRAAGAKTVAVLYGAGTEAQLREENPDAVLSTPEELEHLIKTICSRQHASQKN